MLPFPPTPPPSSPHRRGVLKLTPYSPTPPPLAFYFPSLPAVPARASLSLNPWHGPKSIPAEGLHPLCLGENDPSLFSVPPRHASDVRRAGVPSQPLREPRRGDDREWAGESHQPNPKRTNVIQGFVVLYSYTLYRYQVSYNYRTTLRT